MKRTLIIVIASVCTFSGIGQSLVNFSQRMANPTYYFPELAGWHGGLQSNLQYRNQWPGTNSTYVTYQAGVDGYSDKLKSGFAFNALHDRFSTGIINNNRIEFSWSPKISLENGLTIMPALSGKYSQLARDWGQYDFTNPNSPYYDPSLTPITGVIHSGSFGTGLGVVFKETFLIAHAHDINRPDMTFFSKYPSRLPITYSFLAGRIFTYEDFKVTPSITYHRQDIFNLLTIACNAQYKWIYVGAKYDFNGLAGVALGTEIKQRVRMSYSYDVTTSRLATQNLGSHELALRIWLFKDKAKKQFLSNLPLM